MGDLEMMMMMMMTRRERCVSTAATGGGVYECRMGTRGGNRREQICLHCSRASVAAFLFIEVSIKNVDSAWPKGRGRLCIQMQMGS